MIQSKRINGIDISYVILDPAIDDIRAAYLPGATVKEMGQGWEVASNFNYANTSSGMPIGRLIVDGQTVVEDIPKTVQRDELYMLPDHILHIGKAPVEALWSVEGSPRILRNGQNAVQKSIQRDQLGADIWQSRAYRTVVGLTATGQLVIVRTRDTVMVDDLPSIMSQLGCVDALNGDGGGSSYLWPADIGWGRKLGSAIVARKREESKVKKPILIIDAGHGGKDPGGGSNKYWLEKDMTLKISLYQQKRFAEIGVSVAMTRTSDVSLSESPRTEAVKASGATYCISNHINTGGGHGWEIIHSIYDDGKLADAIKKEFDKLPIKESRIFTRTYPGDAKKDYYYMQRETGACVTQIIEYGFADNADDTAYLKDHWKDMAESVVKAFCGFIGHAYTAPNSANEYSDVLANRWSAGAIKKVSDAGIMSGYPDGTFKPTGNVTREELAAVVAGLLGRGK